MKIKTKITIASSAGLFTLGLFGFTNVFSNALEPKMLKLNEENKTSLVLKEVDEINSNPDSIVQSITIESKLIPKGEMNTYFKKQTIENVFNNISKVVNPKSPFDIDKVLEKKWDVDIGNMSYRSNYELVGDYLFVGSNGSYFRDWRHTDEKSGVYKINVKNGKVLAKFCDGNLGDMDVNGLLYYKGSLFFGNDNDEFISADLNGEINWRIPVSGDIEHKPNLIKNNGKDVVVFATETGEIRAVDPKTGNTVWQHRDQKFNGWKEGDNRFVFKLKAHFMEGNIFFNEPALVDFNNDGIQDVLYGGSKIKAVNGLDGTVLWSIPGEYIDVAGKVKYQIDIHKFTPLVLGSGNNTKVLTYANEISNVELVVNGSHVEQKQDLKILVFNKRGELINKIPISSEHNSGYNANYFKNCKINNQEAAFVSNNTIYIYNSEKNLISIVKQFNKFSDENEWGYVNQELGGTIEIAPCLFKTNVGPCRLVKWEFGPKSNNEVRIRQSIIKLFRVDDNSEVLTLRLPSAEEGPLLIKDIDKDGKKELLVECNGKLICYDLSSLKI